MANINLNVKVDGDLKKEAEQILKGLELPMSTALNMFFRQVIMARGLPFDARLSSPGEEMLDAMKALNLFNNFNDSDDGVMNLADFMDFDDDDYDD